MAACLATSVVAGRKWALLMVLHTFRRTQTTLKTQKKMRLLGTSILEALSFLQAEFKLNCNDPLAPQEHWLLGR